MQYLEWLKKVQDPDTGEFYKQRDNDWNIIVGTAPKHVVRRAELEQVTIRSTLRVIW